MDRHIIEKFFNDTCTAEEAEQVTEWFATPEGQTYIAKRMQEDVESLQNKRMKSLLSRPESAVMWHSVTEKMALSKKYNSPFNPRNKVASYWYAAAVILLMFISSAFFYWTQMSHKQRSKNKQAIHFATNNEQQKTLTLRDGTKIRLNSRSQLWISAVYGQKSREVNLKGEAYFEVKHNEDKPFVIHTSGVSIKDLGTAFDVRAIPGEKNVQVAVKQGRVSIHSKQNPKKKTVELVRGQFGYFNLKTDSVSIDEFEVENYLSWMNKRFKFDEVPLKKVSRQLGHIYNISFKYSSDSLKRMKFSTDFERSSLKKALAVISLTLDISYKIEKHRVIWYKKE